MNTKTSASRSWWSLVLGIGGLLALIWILAVLIPKTIPPASMATSTQFSTTTLMVTASVEVSPSNVPSEDIMGTKNAQDAQFNATGTAAAQTPWWAAATPWPPPTQGPTPTPDFSDVRHQEAGNGTIVWSFLQGVKDYPIMVYNQWYDNTGGTRVFAGSTDPDQGAVGVLTPQTKPLNPEIYLTPRKSGNVEIVDAQGERLVLQSTTNGDLFYFDLPTRSFVDSLTVTVTAPTVTSMPTETPFPTIPWPPIAPSTPTEGAAYPPPITPTPNPTASALPPQETGTSQP